jgi:hypothetical protein
MSALPPKADINGCIFDVRYVPKQTSAASFDHLVSARNESCLVAAHCLATSLPGAAGSRWVDVTIAIGCAFHDQTAQLLGQPFVSWVFQDPNDRFNNLDIVLTLPNESALNFRKSRCKVRHASVGHGCDDLI